ncbi:MAG TPA: glycosyltransferase family 39 protein [Paracoccaceae bacterium]|nr:glycosyltransferase family 39 protein [Paracoccaceae bacterium]
MARRRKIADRTWTVWTLGVILLAALAREGWNALALVPAHFDEAQYWLYGEAPALGYYSKPPLAAWMIRAATEALGDTLFALRLFSPLCHLWIAWLVYAAARRLFDARTGFWAALGYSLAPGVTASAGLMTTDPPMMLGWAGAFYALVRILTRRGRGVPESLAWWAVLGASLGVGMLAKYTALVLAGGGLGYALFSREGPWRWRWRGPLVAAAAFLALWSPNLIWLLANGFASLAHLSENADQGAGFTPGGLPEFLGTQAGVIGPVFLLALLWAGWRRSDWRGDWRLRLLFWLSAPLFLAMCVQSLLGGANANWAAPSYIAGSIVAAWWLLRRAWARALRLQLGIGVAAALLLWGLAALYAEYGTGLPRFADPYKKTRLAGPFCDRVIAAMEETGTEILLSDDRRRLAECGFAAALAPGQIRIWNPADRVTNHFEMVASLAPPDGRPMLLALLNRDGERQAAHFAFAEPVDAGEFSTHADRTDSYTIWLVQGFRGY